MAQNAIRPHIETIVSSYLNTVKNADKAALEKPFTIENDAKFIHNVEQLIASSYMLGIYHADEETGKNVNAADTDIPPIPFTEAVNFLKGKVPMTKKEWSSLEPKLRFRAFTVAKLGSAKTIDVARQQLISALEDGSGYAETWQRIKDTLQDEAKTLTPGYWENVFRTNTQSAYIAGKLEQYEKNGVAAYQLMVIEDDRTSKICRNLLNNATGYGLILPVNHQFWKTYGFPPYHYQCRTSISGLKKSQLGKDGNNVDNISMKQLKDFKPLKDFGTSDEWWKITPSQVKQASRYKILYDAEDIKEKIIGDSIGGAEEVLKEIDKKAEAINNAIQAIREKTSGYITNYKAMTIAEKQEAVEKWLVRKGVASNTERMVITDLEGNILGICKGASNNVNPTEKMNSLLRTAEHHSLVVNHNHRSGTSFSYDDIVTLNSTKSIKSLVVAGHNGLNYYLSIPDGKYILENELKDYYIIAREKALKKVNRISKKNKQLCDIHDITIKEIAKHFKWIYRG